jgi:hypothetical protein
MAAFSQVPYRTQRRSTRSSFGFVPSICARWRRPSCVSAAPPHSPQEMHKKQAELMPNVKKYGRNYAQMQHSG